MKHHRDRPRLRRIAKWVGLVFSVAIVALAVASGWFYIYWASSPPDERQVVSVVFQGVVGFAYLDPGRLAEGWSLIHGRFWGWKWWIELDWGNSTRVVVIPLWMLLLVVAAPTAWLWWLDRRRPRPGHCHKCGYDLRGNLEHGCPECGWRREGAS